jgi:hypothetical protein
MEMNTLSCPNCTAPLDYVAGKNSYTCPFCGTTSVIESKAGAVISTAILNDQINALKGFITISKSDTIRRLQSCIEKGKNAKKNLSTLRAEFEEFKANYKSKQSFVLLILCGIGLAAILFISLFIKSIFLFLGTLLPMAGIIAYKVSFYKKSLRYYEQSIDFETKRVNQYSVNIGHYEDQMKKYYDQQAEKMQLNGAQNIFCALKSANLTCAEAEKILAIMQRGRLLFENAVQTFTLEKHLNKQRQLLKETNNKLSDLEKKIDTNFDNSVAISLALHHLPKF